LRFTHHTRQTFGVKYVVSHPYLRPSTFGTETDEKSARRSCQAHSATAWASRSFLLVSLHSSVPLLLLDQAVRTHVFTHPRAPFNYSRDQGRSSHPHHFLHPVQWMKKETLVLWRTAMNGGGMRSASMEFSKSDCHHRTHIYICVCVSPQISGKEIEQSRRRADGNPSARIEIDIYVWMEYTVKSIRAYDLCISVLSIRLNGCISPVSKFP
jgi:hypothetical protein